MRYREMIVDDVVINKCNAIESCLMRINTEYAKDPKNLQNLTKQDAILLNLQRACESAIDLAMHLVSTHKLGIPQSSRDGFDLLSKHQLLSLDLCARMKKMVGFRNIAIHQYEKLNLDVLRSIIELHLDDFRAFISSVKLLQKTPEM